MNSDKKFVTLNNGAKMPTIGMGTWHHGPREEIDAALRRWNPRTNPKWNYNAYGRSSSW